MKLNKVILIIMDGLGLSNKKKGNCVAMAETSCLNWMKTQSFTELNASGKAVGLSKGIQGNSEVGHLTIGAGRIILQPLEKINQAIKSKKFFKNKELIKAINYSKKNNSALHLIGMISDEGVHSHLNHLIALLELSKKLNQKKIFIHAITDGRDVPEKSAEKFIKKIQKKGIGKIASLSGRFYAMDRDKNWNRTKQAFELITQGKGIKENNALQAIKNQYLKGIETDYYIEPILIEEKGLIQNNDSIIFFNFRTDRPRQLSLALTSKKFNYFKRNKTPKIYFTSMTHYSKEIKGNYAFKEEKIKNNLGKILAKNNLNQLRIAETEKYAHVTYFFNSQNEKPFKKEKRILIPSLKDKSYDLHPKMSAEKITETALNEIKKQKHEFILINYANCDLVGHSAKIPAVIKAVETVDKETCKIIHEAIKNNYLCVITADHGSAEEKLYSNGTPKPSHSCNPVPFAVIGKKIKLKKGGLKDIAPTILKLMNLKKPKEMNGKSLISEKNA
jgi:2,3-bisphosphoglycerate-independent phosphoglycerate mutase